jgi:hypothetical protein
LKRQLSGVRYPPLRIRYIPARHRAAVYRLCAAFVGIDDTRRLAN